MGELIPFPGWIFPFPVSKINFELLGEMENCFEKEVVSSEACKYHKK